MGTRNPRAWQPCRASPTGYKQPYGSHPLFSQERRAAMLHLQVCAKSRQQIQAATACLAELIFQLIEL